MMNNFIEELKWRGMLHDIMPGADNLLTTPQSGYIGFDPTADSLHVGSLVQIMTLLHFQRCGHRPIALVGGATGMVGDPSGKSEERNLLSEDIIENNLNGIKKQLQKFIDFSADSRSAMMVNNYDWFKDFKLLDFIRDTGKHITISYMMAKDSVQKRLETGLSFTEFTYQLIQGYDFLHLYRKHGCKLQMGGSDQWGNMVTGTELIRRMEQGDAYAVTTKLITKKADGSKFGKTESGNVWLDARRTSPYRYYQFWLNTSDEDAGNYIKIFTLKEKEECEALIASHKAQPHLRVLQKALADDITARTHSDAELKQAIDASEILFGKATAESLGSLSEELLLDIMDGVPLFTVDKNLFEHEVNAVELLAVNTSVFPSKAEARKMITAGGVSINKSKVTDAGLMLGKSFLIKDKYLIIQKGKKNYYLVIAG